MLNTRLQTILRLLMGAEQPLTGDYLANQTEVTARTTRQDIKNLAALLDGHGAVIQSIMGKGYILEITEQDKFRTYLQSCIGEEDTGDEKIPASPEERVAYMMKRLLLSDSFIKLDDVADEMYISRSTVQNDLKQVKQILSDYDIQLQTRPNHGLKVAGSEMKLRFCIAEHVFDRDTSPGNHVANLPLLPQKELKIIQAIILRQIKENHITLSDIAVHNLLIHIAIACKRIRSGYHVSLVKTDIQEVAGQIEYGVAERIVSEVEGMLDVQFPQTETAYVAIHLMGTKMLRQNGDSEKVVAHIIDEELLQLIHIALKKINEEMHMDLLDDDELTIGLGLHLKPARNRYKYGMNVRNPMLSEIKRNYPLAFEAGVIFGLAFEDVTGIKIDENEVGYLALHIGAAIERKKMKSGPKRCLIVCASGRGTSQLIYYKLKNHFGKNLDVAGTTEYYNLNHHDLHSFDFVVSSIPIAESLPVPVIEVNAIVDDQDLKKIESQILGTSGRMENYFKADVMFLQMNFTTKDAVLEFMYNKLLKEGLVEPTLLDAIKERENIAPTAFGNLVAIPHPVTPQSNETFLSVCTLKKPIMWQDKPVQFICLLCVKKDSQEDLQAMYDLLGKVIESSTVVQKLINAKTYTAFMNILLTDT
ncbi:BglG family transcription antiterminator [Virgibacillus halophilus]|uniref:BglG family transcription antiterminator n=1 Tax=Tigheibacillus halophilus TaxID=361280 RepID=A0ABU5C3W3_9BACI|nr:BglG family transcription antiterminator [Virgibacillus halophilus]